VKGLGALAAPGLLGAGEFIVVVVKKVSRDRALDIADPDTMGSISIPGYRAYGFLTMNGM
jgi:hypothetical protein